MEKQERIFGKEITNVILQKHFQTFTQSLRQHNPKYKEIRLTKPELKEPTEHYICPLCVTAQIVVFGNILRKAEEFTLDHVPPESIGGKLKLLTCKICNNTAGEYEAALIEYIRFRAFSDKKEGAMIKKLSVKKELGDSIKHKGFMSTDKEGYFVLDFPTQALENNPDLKNLLDQFGQSVQEIQITINTPDEEKLTKALLKSAYLLCFIQWGYEFVYSEVGYKIRQVLQGEEKYPIKLPVVFVDAKKQELPIGIGIIQKPTEVQSYYVTIPCADGDNNYTALILIPPPIKEEWYRLSEIHEFYIKNNGVNHEYIFNPLQQSLPDNLNGYSENWESYKRTRK